MTFDKIKHKMQDGVGTTFLKVVDKTETGARGMEYARKNPGKAAKKTAAKIVASGFSKPLKALALTGAAIAKEGATRTLPWAGKKIVAGGKSTLKGAATTARRMNDGPVDMEKPGTSKDAVEALVRRVGEGRYELDTGTLETLLDGMTASMQVHKVIVANKRAIKIDWSNVGIHVGSTVLIKGAKIAAMTALLHIPGMQHLPLAHLLNEQDKFTDIHIESGWAEGGLGYTLGKAGEHKFGDSLERSNAKAYDLEMWARSDVQAKNKHAVRKMAKAMASLEAMLHAQTGTAGVGIKHSDVERVRAGLEAAQEMAGFVGTEQFTRARGEVDVGAAAEMASSVMARYNLRASSHGTRSIPPAVLPQDKGKQTGSAVSERTRGYFARRAERRAETSRPKIEERAKTGKLRELEAVQKAEDARASKYKEKFHKADTLLKHMEVDNAERARKGKPIVIDDLRHAERKDASLRRDLALVRQGYAKAQHTAIDAGTELDAEVITYYETQIADLSAKVFAQASLLQKLLPFDDRMTWSGIKHGLDSRVARMTDEITDFDKTLTQIDADLQTFADEANHDPDQKWRAEMKKVEQRRTKVEAKREISRLQKQLAESDLALGKLLVQSKSSAAFIEDALKNRLTYREVETKLYAADIDYDEEAATQHRSSAWVQKHANFSDTGGKGVNAMAKFAWWSFAMFPLTALPYWGIRRGTTALRDSNYLSYMKATLNDDRVEL